MKCLLSLLLALLVSGVTLQSQSLSEAVDQMAMELAQQLKAQNIKEVAVADFTYQGQPLTRIGKHVADRLSVKLGMNSTGKYEVTNRETVRQELSKPQVKNTPSTTEVVQTGQSVYNALESNETDTEEEKNRKMLDAGSKLVSTVFKPSTKPLKGVDIIVFGDIENMSDFLHMTVQLTKNDTKKGNIGGALAEAVITPDIAKLLEERVAAPQQPVVVRTPRGGDTTPSTSPGRTATGNAITFKHQNLQFEVIGCTQSGRDMECKLNILASDEDVNLHTYNPTRILDANGGHEFKVTEMKLADVSTTSNGVSKTLVAGFPIEAVFRFTNVNRNILSISKLEIHCWMPGGGFIANLNSIPVAH